MRTASHLTLSTHRLNDRQRAVLFCVCKGLRNAEIGRHLSLSERSVKSYVSQLLLIFDVTNRTELVGALASEDYSIIQGLFENPPQ
jgi:DNA-binding NarL/FixJ family response regulator